MAVVIFRIEDSNGVYRAYQINVDTAVIGASEAFAEYYGDMPSPIKKAVDTFLFALRHGPIQAMFKQQQCSPIEVHGADKNTQTVGQLVQLYFATIMNKSKDKDTGDILPIDMPANQLSFLMGHMIQRVEEYDHEPTKLLESAEAIVSAE